MADTASLTDIVYYDNTTFSDAFQFGTSGDTTWSFTGYNFRMDIKGDADDTTAMLSLTSDAGEIVVDDVTTRVLHFNVPEATFSTAGLTPGIYVYDLIMYDGSTPAVRSALMRGTFEVKHGISGG